MPAASPLKTSNAQIDSAEDDAVLPTPDPSAGPKVSLPTGAALGGDSDSEPIVIDDDSSEGNNSVVELSPPPKETSRSQRQTRSMQQTSSPSSPRATQIAQLPTERRASAEDRFTDFGQQDDSDDLPTTPAITRRKGSKNTGTAEQRSSPFIVEDDDDESDDIQVVSSRRRRSPKKRSRREDRESSGDEVITSSPRKKLRRGRDRRSSLSKEEQQELKDEIQDLASSGSDDEVKIRQSQRKLSSQKTAREMALERLKQKRAGALPVVEEDEELDSEDEQDVDQLEDEDEDEDDEVARVPYSSTRDMFARDEDDEGFVLEDEDGPSGVPQGLPLAFTRFASMKAKDLFKYAVEWMVQKKINPAFQIDDEVYDLAFKKLDDEVAGLAGSKFRSSAWTQDFALALQARPQIAFAPINRKSAEHFMRDKCDACNRSGHPATYEIQFQGKPYHRLTLEDVANGDDDEDFDSDESGSNHQNHGPDRDAKGRIILPEHTIFYVGKFCKGMQKPHMPSSTGGTICTSGWSIGCNLLATILPRRSLRGTSGALGRGVSMPIRLSTRWSSKERPKRCIMISRMSLTEHGIRSRDVGTPLPEDYPLVYELTRMGVGPRLEWKKWEWTEHLVNTWFSPEY
ncbi:hypothetical protein H2203_008721 [Taxawa tesnikishii (nom. ined.)]|nr:hypothetical protein H2203_008721 [Dothideales sp. JES 119]